MTTVFAILGVATAVAAVAALVKVLSERIEWLKRWSWHLAVGVGATGFVIAIIAWISYEAPATKADLDASSEKLVCRIDSLKQFIREGNFPAAKEQAECIDATQILESARDSGVVQLGLGNYRAALSLLAVARQATRDSAALAEVFFYMGVAALKWADHFAEADKSDSATPLYETALTYNDSSLSYKPDSPEAWNNRGGRWLS